jgi:hypothetical protein
MIPRAVEELLNVTAAGAMQKLGDFYTSPDPIKFTKNDSKESSGSDLVRVVVTGTLAGGTGSGTFIDLGYLLRLMPQLSNQPVDGIFSIPADGSPVPSVLGNSYAALTELNHFFHPSVRFRAKYPNEPVYGRSTDKTGFRPYDYFFVMQPRTTGEDARSLIRSAIVEYITIDATGDSPGQIKNRLTDALAAYASEHVDEGSTLYGKAISFASLGASVVEYPVDHIISGCAAKLATGALNRLCEVKLVTEHGFEEFLRQNARVRSEDLEASFLGHEAIRQIIDQLNGSGRRAFEAASKGSPNQINEWLVKVEGDAGVYQHRPMASFTGESASLINKAVNALAKRARERVEDELKRRIIDPAFGPDYVADLCRRIAQHSRERLDVLENPASELSVYTGHEASQGRVTSVRVEVEKPSGCLGLFKKKKVTELSRTWGAASESYIESSFAVRSTQLERSVMEQLGRIADVWRHRIEHPTNGLRLWLMELKREMSFLADQRANNAPPVNGLVLFTPGQTVKDEFNRCLPSERAIVDAEQRFLSTLEPKTSQVFLPESQNAFQQEVNIVRSDLDPYLARIRSDFQSVGQPSVCEMLTLRNSWQTDLNAVLSKADPFIRIDWAGNPYGAPGSDTQRAPSYCFMFDPDASGGTPEGEVSQFLKSTAFSNQFPLESRHRIVLLRGLCIFTLDSIVGVRNWASQMSQARHTRTDIAWKNLDGSPIDRNRVKNVAMLLTGLALGDLQLIPSPYRLALDVPAGPDRPARNLKLPAELTEASFELSKEPELVAGLDRRLRQSIASIGVDQAARKIDEFRSSPLVGNLTYEHSSMDGVGYSRRRSAFTDTVPGLSEAILGLYPDWVAPSIESYLQERRGIRGYYCPSCETFLALPDSTVSETIQRYCPNCGWQLRFD